MYTDEKCYSAFSKKLETKHGLTLFAWLINRTFSDNE
jgi:hypothetical protein